MDRKTDPMKAPGSGVTVRMYRPGFGDCFLLAFRGAGGKPFYMLIDCGVHGGWSGGPAQIEKVVSHIREATGGHIHVVVVTHEHADHVSGFGIAREIFEKIDVDEVWFAWTEDPVHPLAKKIRGERSKMLRALTEARNSLAAQDPVAQRMGSALSFFELPQGFALSTRDAQQIIAERASQGPRYFEPKKAPLTLPGVDGVRIFVLGPPVDEKRLRKANPSSKEGEVYEFWTGLELAQAGALMGAAAADYAPQGGQPFAFDHRVPSRWVKGRKEVYRFFHEHYGFGDADPGSWRRIETDWVEPAGNLALKLDAATNNTSLVLAIELLGRQRVLLFPGDAQVGNWLSWHDGGWTQENGLAPGESLQAEDLLRRTVLYKVSHHGSHNATLRERGLELMTSDELAAMIPTNEKWALARRPHPWKMPFKPLYEDLLLRTKGRILRTDHGRIARPAETAPSIWKTFSDRSREHDLYLELEVPDR